MAVTEASPVPTSPFLEGVFAPVHDELDVPHLEVTGELPADLDGTFLRNGPNPQFAPLGPYHWFDGDGMLHAIEVRDGTARYRNRWIDTPGLRHERAAGRSLFGGLQNIVFPPRELLEECGVLKNVANTNVVRHAGRTLAVWEGGWPTEVDDDLRTVGLHSFDGRLEGAMTAHPKWCPETGELMFFGYVPMGGPPFLRYHVVDASGALVHSTPITIPRGVMMHDFLTTRHHSLFFDLPAVLAMDGGQMWQPQHGARIGVLPRHGVDADVRWFDIDPCYVFHFLNAWEEGDRIIALGCRLPSVDLNLDRANERGTHMGEGAGLTRWTIDLTTGKVDEQRLDDRRADFPRLHDGLVGLPHRYGHASWTQHGGAGAAFDSLVQWDVTTGEEETYGFGAGHVIGEAVFAPRPGATHERDGWLMVHVTDERTMRSDVAVLEAEDITAGPVARIHLPRRVPAGFHGGWFARGAAGMGA